jgi:hypothetical protein
MYIYMYIYMNIYIYVYIYVDICKYICIYPLSAEMLERLARFVRKLPKGSNLAEDGFPGLVNQEFLGSFSTNYSICSS